MPSRPHVPDTIRGPGRRPSLRDLGFHRTSHELRNYPLAPAVLFSALSALFAAAVRFRALAAVLCGFFFALCLAALISWAYCLVSVLVRSARWDRKEIRHRLAKDVMGS